MKTDGLNSVERFSNRVENYVKYRPSYPAAVLTLYVTEMGLTKDSVIADIGSGTGISSLLFLENGNTVFGVEPNARMRGAAEGFLGRFENFHSIGATAESTGLPDGSVDFVIAAQAFHWFDPEGTRAECRRILRPGGWVVLLWNERQLDANEFHREYEQLLLKHASDYKKVRHDNVDETMLEGFFGKSFERAVFPNTQLLDLEGLRGRSASASYMPAEGDERFAALENDLRRLFAKHAESGRITVFYDTKVFYTRY